MIDPFDLTMKGQQTPPLVELQRCAWMIDFYQQTAFADPFASTEDRANAMKAITRLRKQQDTMRAELRQ